MQVTHVPREANHAVDALVGVDHLCNLGIMYYFV